MHGRKKAWLAAGLIVGAAAMTGCTANIPPVTTPTPQAAQKATGQPATAQPSPQTPEATMETAAEPGGEETPAPLSLRVDGKEAAAHAVKEQGTLLLPLIETGELLGWKADSQQTEEETQVKRVIALEKDGSRITVSWTVSDNTTRGVTWQKDGLLIPVDTKLTTLSGTVYVPAAFFEAAMDAQVSEREEGVTVAAPKPKDTLKTREDSAGENG